MYISLGDNLRIYGSEQTLLSLEAVQAALKEAIKTDGPIQLKLAPDNALFKVSQSQEVKVLPVIQQASFPSSAPLASTADAPVDDVALSDVALSDVALSDVEIAFEYSTEDDYSIIQEVLSTMKEKVIQDVNVTSRHIDHLSQNQRIAPSIDIVAAIGNPAHGSYAEFTSTAMNRRIEKRAYAVPTITISQGNDLAIKQLERIKFQIMERSGMSSLSQKKPDHRLALALL